MLVVMIGIRKSLDCIFTRRELKILDDIMPEITRRAHAEDLHHLEDGTSEVGCFKKFSTFCLGHKTMNNKPHSSPNTSTCVNRKP